MPSGLPVDAPGVVRLIVDEEWIAGIHHLAQHLARVGSITLDAALVHAFPLLDLLLAVPGQRVPVADQHLALPNLSSRADDTMSRVS